MRKGRGRSDTLIPEPAVDAFEEKSDRDEQEGSFFACYLLCSLSPRYKGHTYIGFTINPRRRIRQHNGEIRCGAWKTKCGRPWEMILCIYGFPSNVSALQFEWAWQHPTESLAVRKAAASFKSLSGIANKIKLARTMLTLPPWENLNLRVNFFSTKYVKYSAGCPSLPKHMRVNVRAMDELPCYMEGQILDDDDDDDDDGNGDDDNEVVDGNLSAVMETSANHCLEDGYSMQGALCDHLSAGWGEYDDFRQKWVPDVKSSKIVDQEIRISSSKSESYGMAYCDDFFRREEFYDYRQPVASPDSSSLIVSPMHINKDKATTSSDTLSSCSKEPFECFEKSGLAQLKQPSTPRTDKNVVSCGSSLLSPESSVIINLSTPSSCIRRSCNKGASVHPEIIDLTDSPLCVQL